MLNWNLRESQHQTKTMNKKVVITGGNGFLGWHVRCALREQGIDAQLMPLGNDFDVSKSVEILNGANQLIHIAGVNRADEGLVKELNLLFASQVVETLQKVEAPPGCISYSNSTQSDTNSTSEYGQAKTIAAEMIREQALKLGIDFYDVKLPNLYGEGGKPFYNAVTSTFCHLLAQGEEPEIITDSELRLMHAQDAADHLIFPKKIDFDNSVHLLTVSELLTRLKGIAEDYKYGQIPDISTPLSRSLFNTYRSYRFPKYAEFVLERKADNRGSLFEIIRTHGGVGQSSFSTTVPGISRGEHFHRRKVERFTVLSGQARISLRKMFSNEVIHFDVDDQNPTAIDMPTLWAHKITNTGESPLFTAFWVDELFSPDAPDTFPEIV